MSPQDFSAAYYPSAPGNGAHAQVIAPARPKQRYWLHALMFAVTLATTTIVGARMDYNFTRDLPFFDLERDLAVFESFWREPAFLLRGLPFSLTLLTILLAHEFGHYFACVYYRVDASLPYFLPAPTFTGTLGAFIRIRAPDLQQAGAVRYRGRRAPCGIRLFAAGSRRLAWPTRKFSTA